LKILSVKLFLFRKNHLRNYYFQAQSPFYTILVIYEINLRFDGESPGTIEQVSEHLRLSRKMPPISMVSWLSR